MQFPFYHLIVYTPVTHADVVRKALADAGAGKIGRYDSCSFSVRGTGRFRPLEGANPAIGSVGNTEEVEEERIEVIVPSDKQSLRTILQAVKKVHPYQEPAIHLLQMVDDRSR
ncbi:MAG: hypothetical protein Greene041619_1014 [Candidatus Peregrinibacteria bacterium Greene0416_19]|nr:MAG: hypothetical protein Greene041619_1014 [Candidatus Peregrinibacteria bacterium Greene0416_19]